MARLLTAVLLLTLAASLGSAHEHDNVCPPPPTSTTPAPTTITKPPTTITVPTTCVTVTDTTGTGCPINTCPIVPECILLSTIVNPCGCTGIDHVTSCKTTCGGGCQTSYSTLYLPCPTSPVSPTTTPKPPPTTITNSATFTVPTTCITITDTTGTGCPVNTCTIAECILLSTVVNPCSCADIEHVTSCKTTCDGACQTTYSTLYLPCATSVLSPTTTA